MLESGIKGQHTILVEKENTAAVMKSGTLAVFATPAMIARNEGDLQHHFDGSGWKTPCIFRRSRG